MTYVTLIADFRHSTNELTNALRLFTQEQLNQVPFSGSWTPGQVGQHLLKSETGVSELFRGATQAANRDPEALSPAIRGIFLDFNSKLQAPDFIIPDNTPQDRDQLIRSLEDNRAAVLRLAEVSDTDLLLMDFPVPQLGELTGKEWLTFVTVHSLRHVNQLKKIHQHIMQPQA